MPTEILTEAQIGVLGGVSELTTVGSFYLAGGTALALRHGHRRSIDFDFFRQDAFDGYGLITSLANSSSASSSCPRASTRFMCVSTA